MRPVVGAITWAHCRLRHPIYDARCQSRMQVKETVALQAHRRLPVKSSCEEGRRTPSKASHRKKKNYANPVLHAFGKITLTISEHGSLHGSAGLPADGHMSMPAGSLAAKRKNWKKRFTRSHQRQQHVTGSRKVLAQFFIPAWLTGTSR